MVVLPSGKLIETLTKARSKEKLAQMQRAARGGSLFKTVEGA
jgi:hypothetical protein